MCTLEKKSKKDEGIIQFVREIEKDTTTLATASFWPFMIVTGTCSVVGDAEVAMLCWQNTYRLPWRRPCWSSRAPVGTTRTLRSTWLISCTTAANSAMDTIAPYDTVLNTLCVLL